MDLLRLTPEIQQHVLAMCEPVRQPAIAERALRPLTQLEDFKDQTARFRGLVELAR